ncbi:MAG: hypothetical protein ACI8ZM_004356 [Crocinitomix sp.]|jgi:hypothetical protein
MKNYLFIISIFLIVLSCNKEDAYVEKIFEGNIELNTQFQVDSFGDLGYTDITGIIGVGSYPDANNSITNLNALSELRSASHLLINYNNALTNISGLCNLKILDAQLIINNNPLLSNLNGLENITFIGGILEISKNESLIEIDGLSNFSSIGDGSGNIRIWGNQNLMNLDGLNNLKDGGWVYIYSNPSLENLAGLSQMKEALYINISQNPQLTNLDGFRRLSKLQYDLDINNNTSLTDFCGLTKLIKNDPLTSEEYNVYSNASNPSQDNISAGNCK